MKLVIRVPNWVGDAVMAVPSLREIRRIYAPAHITHLAKPWVSGLFEDEGLADEIIPVEDAHGLASSVARFMRETRRLRRERFDLAILLQNAFGAALTARAGGVEKIAGYPTDGRRLLLDYSIPLDPNYKSTHQVFYYLKIAAHLERELTGESRVDLENARPTLHVPEDKKDQARRLLSEFGVRAALPGRIVVLNPGATNSRAKQWLPERFAETADLLAERDGFQPAIVGAVGDVAAAMEVAARMRTPAAMLAGRTNIAELKAILACASLVISNDTGTAHVSAALGVPTVVVFGPTEHVSTRPLSDVAAVVRHDVECSPCMLRDCPIDHRCMTRVGVSDVYQAAHSMLARAGCDWG